MKISIITPMYNTEEYIERCIRSIYNNNPFSFEDFEVIVVNDGSTDKSQIIVEGLQQEYNNIQLINKENGGQSTARNIGFRLAKGEYIFCLDSDDWIDANQLAKAYTYASNNKLDMLPVYFSGVNEKDEIIEEQKDNYEISEHIFTGPEFLNKFVISGTMWRYLYKSDIIHKNNLRLIEGVYHEDEDFVIRFLTYVKRISYASHHVYYYLERSDSTVNKPDEKHRIRLLYDMITVIQSLDTTARASSDILAKKGVTKKQQQLALSILIRLRNERFNKSSSIDIIKKLKKQGYFPLDCSELILKQKFACLFFNIYYSFILK